jgi:predicted porin
MHKKLMAAAVAGAFAAPVGAFAATSNVDIYGYLNVEYGIYQAQPDLVAGTAASGDALNSGASRIGFRDKEDLGGGLTAWGQCETQVNGVFGPSSGQSGLCNRNSAVGLQGSFGNVFIGRWDSPMKRANGITRIINEAGWTGGANMMVQGVGPGGEALDFSLRNGFSVNWDSPNWGGFRLMVQTTTQNATLNSTENANVDGRRNSIAGVFRTGPLAVTAAYEEHTDNAGTDAAFAGDGGKETGYQVGATYKLSNWLFGLTYNNIKGETAAGADLKRGSYNLAVEYDLAGPGKIRAGYTMSDKWDGSLAAGTTDTGGSQWQIGYLHSFSKRTTGGIIVAGVENQDQGTWNFTNLDEGPGTVAPGEGGTVLVLQLIHTF